MSLSDWERRALAEMEQELRREDPPFAHRIDALNASPCHQGPQRFACQVSACEVVCVFLTVVMLTGLCVLVILTAGHRQAPPPSQIRVTGTATGEPSAPPGGHARTPQPAASP
ncbi:DUF3040 domain-containing protein [Nonomuraea deserti]|uniref:DUF3040 domain-containing protein n=1 Tax=Nonomuraea deserti TaxID=1848322 RepID=A0A4R4UD51_9ACTN|nr:DUF3040 domain-containing protein [Nonomuraea deserti]TDC89230.1 DUF3040 domain-containing protein [Nonomuraea deserti]